MIQEIRASDEEVLLRLQGKVYADEAAMIREKLFPFLDNGCSRIVVDVAEVSYIDSSGLGVLVALLKRARQNGGGVTLAGLQGEVLQLFELTRLTKVFDIE